MLLALSLALTAQGPTVELYRGAATVAGHRYWAVEDATLDANAPQANLGGQAILAGGPGQKVLVQFRDLVRAVGPGKRIESAQLVLTLAGGEQPVLTRAAALLQPWNEGPARTLSNITGTSEETAPAWSVTWQHRRAGREAIGWQMAGASGERDARSLDGVGIEPFGADAIAITGLGPDLQRQLENPLDNHGFLLQFEKPVEFMSSNASQGRPRLLLRLADAAPRTGADLSVVRIARTPEFDRYDLDGSLLVADQDGVPVPVPGQPPSGTLQKWPVEGQRVTYTATIRNVGDAPAAGFSYKWLARERDAASLVDPRTIAPGQEVTVTTETEFRNLHSDHRLLPLELQLTPSGPDAVAANNALRIEECALAVGVFVEQSVADAFKAAPNPLGSRSLDDYLQHMFRVWNEAVFPYSRFSFAPDGVLERVRLQSVQVVPDGTADAPKTLALDAEVFFGKASGLSPSTPVHALLPLLSEKLGLVSLAATSFAPSDQRLAQFGMARGAEDRFPGLMGGGDTRFEGGLPGSIGIPYEAASDPLASSAFLEPTDLYSATDVAALNSNLGRRRGHTGEALYDVPVGILLSVTDFQGRKLPNVQLSFFQMAGGAFRSVEPTLRLSSGASGSVLVRPRPIGSETPINTFTGHTLRPNPFGRIAADLKNGAFLVKAEANGATEWAWLKLWQAVDTYHRGQKTIALMTLRVNLPSQALEPSQNYAKGRLGTDAKGTPAPALAALTDGDETTSSEGGGEWLEIDLGRDRPIGELRLVVDPGAPLWNEFEVRVYGTGQRPEEAIVWAREVDWAWSARNRSDAPGKASVAYRGVAQRFRYVRLVPKTPGPVKIAEVVAVPVRFDAGG